MVGGTLAVVLLTVSLAVQGSAKPTTAGLGRSSAAAPVSLGSSEAEHPAHSGREPRAPSRWRGERISLSLKDADLRDVLRSFAELAGFDLVLHPDVRGSVTLELHDVPWDQALAVILRTHGLGADLGGGRIWAVGPAQAP